MIDSDDLGFWSSVCVFLILVFSFCVSIFYFNHSERMNALEIRQMIVRDSLDNLRN